MSSDDVLYDKLIGVNPESTAVGKILIGERLYYFNSDLNVTGVKDNRTFYNVTNAVNMYDELFSKQPVVELEINGRLYCAYCGKAVKNTDHICPACARIIRTERELFTPRSLDDYEIRLTGNSQEFLNERVRSVKWISECPLIDNLTDYDSRQLTFKVKDSVSRHFDSSDKPWRFRAQANRMLLVRVVPNLNIRYNFAVENISTDLIKFLKSMMDIDFSFGNDNSEPLNLNPAVVDQLRYSYIQVNSRGLLHDMIKIGMYPDNDSECFSQVIDYLVDHDVVWVDRSGSVEYELDAFVNLDRGKVLELMTVDGYTPELLDGLTFKGE